MALVWEREGGFSVSLPRAVHSPGSAEEMRGRTAARYPWRKDVSTMNQPEFYQLTGGVGRLDRAHARARNML
ncbi:hypothetical protein JYU34_016466 [Plutella xylostella]|uniref:Uncharacterized protein n=1 Tax=Plutella xylostella TaxID=51655 RepID=A0ABQ7Q2Q4_PLUXY|nr:hypothetical protein JYU34_016466 [Plutella xylostella]